MPTYPKRARVYRFPYASQLFDSHIDAIYEEPVARHSNLIVDLQTFHELAAPEQRVIDGRPYELARGEYRPMRLRFTRAAILSRTGQFETFDDLPADHHARRLFCILHARRYGIGNSYLLGTAATEPGDLLLSARSCLLEERPGQVRLADVLRSWAPTPDTPAGLVPHRPSLYRRYGGDPIAIHLGGRLLRNRLFIGGLHHQSGDRPMVDHVLNLCGFENPWCDWHGWHPHDRFAHKGEMATGMGPDDLLAEARWVVEHLRSGKRVLVHCYAGINRSSTVCCAALILLEGLTAEQALARVRETHPIAWPDPYHWFLLRWLSDPANRERVADASTASTADPAAPTAAVPDDQNAPAAVVQF
ncbi:MAG: dual specificity protein phosphatase family protein [Ktedonobacterales bacterium]